MQQLLGMTEDTPIGPTDRSPDHTPEQQAVIDEAEKLVATILSRNPTAKITINTVGAVPFCVIRRLWNDDSMGMLIPLHNEAKTEYLDLVNNVSMPERLSAIYHHDLKKLEVIWTAYKRPKHLEDVVGREFTFQFGNTNHKCSFRRSSDRLLVLANNVVLYGLTESGYRNLQSFDILTGGDASAEDKERLAEPISFFVENIEWHDEKSITLLTHINFYMRYFDALSPQIVIHEPQEATKASKRSRYISKSFPAEITARTLNPTLTSFWSAASKEKDAARKFLYAYRLIEYVAFFHLDDAVRGGVRRVLSGPNTAGNIRSITDRVVELVRDARGDDYARFKAVVIDLVDQSHILKECLLNAKYFAEGLEFDGGFRLKALLPNETAKSLGDHGLDNFVTTLKDIRNALSHGRDQKSGQIILPTLANLKRLQPWANLITIAAAEVVLYEGIS